MSLTGGFFPLAEVPAVAGLLPKEAASKAQDRLNEDMNPTLNLVVLKVRDLARSKTFYEALGLALVEEQHGQGPVHYSWSQNGIVFELYPAGEAKIAPGLIRLGFAVANVDAVVAAVENAGGGLATAPRDSAWGRRAVVRDPDGYRVEIAAASQQ
jgi:catechol 2,3-dioxygenase-like lactoylglutathione lyase family enzyme